MPKPEDHAYSAVGFWWREALHEPPLSRPSGTLPLGGGEGWGEGAVRRFMVPMHSKKRKWALHEPTAWPPGFGLRQSSGAFTSAGLRVPKAAEGRRSPRRSRGGAPTSAVHGSNAR